MRRIIIAAIILAISSCKRDALESITGQQTGPYSSMQDFYNQHGVQAQTFTFNPDNPFLIPGNYGTQINVPGNSLIDSFGNQPTGNITATLKEIYNIKDMILSHVPATSGGYILQSGGMFYLSFSSGSVQYHPTAPLYVEMPSSNPVFGMSVFFGIPDDSSGTGINWIQQQTPVYIDSLNQNYTMYLDSLGYGWINCDMFYNSPQPTDVTITPSVTGEHGETVNLAVYLAFPAINSCMNVYNTSMQQSVTAYNIPLGMQAAAVIIGTGRVTKKPYFGFVTFTVTSAMSVPVSVVPTYEAQIISALQTL